MEEKPKKVHGISVIPVSKNKIPLSQWAIYQKVMAPREAWLDHYGKSGYVGLITGKVSGNFEVIDIDLKNDPTGKIIEEYRALIPDSLYQKLQVVRTPSGGQHYRYRCQEAVIDVNKKLAMHDPKAVLIETRGEGGFVCHHLQDYQVIQGNFNILEAEPELPEITASERELLFELARSLDRSIKDKKLTFTYSHRAKIQFNEEYNILDLFEKHGWTVVQDTADRVLLLRPGSSTSHHSGTYFKESKLFFCFSTSTTFQTSKPYCPYQVMQELEQLKDDRTALAYIGELGYKAPRVNGGGNAVNETQIATFLNERGVRFNKFIQETILDGKVMEEMDANTLYLEACQHFGQVISRTTFETVLKSHLVEKVDPVEDFIEANNGIKPTGALRKWVDCLILKNDSIDKDMVYYFFEKWYVGLVAQCLDGEYPNEFFLVLLSTAQGIGKTTLLRKATLPKDLQAYQREVPISDNDDFKLIMAQSVLIIDDEMDGRTLSEDKTFKSILSRKELPLRRKYDRRLTNLVRRCSFAGCGNQVNVVRERQNRRVIPIELKGIDHDKVNSLDTVAMFMEAYHLFKSGYQYSYSGNDSARLSKLASDYQAKTDLDEIIDDAILNPDEGGQSAMISAIDLINALHYKYPYLAKKATSIQLGKILADRGIETKRVGQNRKTVYLISTDSPIFLYVSEMKAASEYEEIGFEKPRTK